MAIKAKFVHTKRSDQGRGWSGRETRFRGYSGRRFNYTDVCSGSGKKYFRVTEMVEMKW